MVSFFQNGERLTALAIQIIKKVFKQVRIRHDNVNCALFLFGSFGRTEGVPCSDIDLLLVPSASSSADDVEAFHCAMVKALEGSALATEPFQIIEFELTPWFTLKLVQTYARTCNIAYNSWLNTIFVCGDDDAAKEGRRIRSECCNDKARIRQSILFNYNYFHDKANAILAPSMEGAFALKHGVGGARYMLFLSWFARFTDDEPRSDGCGALAGLQALENASLLPENKTMKDMVNRCGRILELKGRIAAENGSYELAPSHDQFPQCQEDAHVILSMTGKIRDYVASTSIVHTTSAQITSDSPTEWINLAHQLVRPATTQSELLQLTEEVASSGMNCLAIEVTRHPNADQVIWRRLIELEHEGRILPAYTQRTKKKLERLSETG